MSHKRPDAKKDKTRSIWDEGIDMDKVNKLTPKERGEMFPNDYDQNGKPIGDW